MNAFFPSLDIGTDPAKIRGWAQAAEKHDLLGLARAARLPLRAERFILDMIPADTDAEPEAPPQSRSASAACFAMSPVCRCGAIRMPVESPMVLVTAARKPSVTKVSWKGFVSFALGRDQLCNERIDLVAPGKALAGNFVKAGAHAGFCVIGSMR